MDLQSLKNKYKEILLQKNRVLEIINSYKIENEEWLLYEFNLKQQEVSRLLAYLAHVVRA